MNSFNSRLIHTTLFLFTRTHTRTVHFAAPMRDRQPVRQPLKLTSFPSISVLSLPARAGGLPPSQISIHTHIRWLASPPELIPLYIPSGSKRGLPSNCFLIPLSPLSLLYARLFSSKQHPQPRSVHPPAPAPLRSAPNMAAKGRRKVK